MVLFSIKGGELKIVPGIDFESDIIILKLDYLDYLMTHIRLSYKKYS